MNTTRRYAALAAGSIALLTSASHAATVDVGWDASNVADGSLASWAASPNSFGTIMTWNGTGTKTSGVSNFPNVSDWVSSPDYNLAGGSADSWQDANAASTSTNASWELVLRPGSFSGNRHIFNSGGNGSGLAFLLEANSIRFVFQNANSNDQRIDLSFDLSTVGSASDFFHIVGTTDVDSAATGIGQLWVNSTSVAGPTTSVGTINDWDGGDLASLGSGAQNHNIPSNGSYPSAAFTGDIALFNFYGGEILTQSDVDAAYTALIPEPSAALLSLIGFGLVLRRRR